MFPGVDNVPGQVASTPVQNSLQRDVPASDPLIFYGAISLLFRWKPCARARQFEIVVLWKRDTLVALVAIRHVQNESLKFFVELSLHKRLHAVI